MKFITAVLAVYLLTFLSACGGSSPPPGQPDQEQAAEEQAQPQDSSTETPQQTIEAETEPPVEGSSVVIYNGASGPVELPLLPEDQLKPNDMELPQLLIFGVKQGQVVYGDVTVSATAIDDTGVNFIALLVDGVPLYAVSLDHMKYNWDTRAFPDGGHLVEFVVRDHGNRIGVHKFSVSSDNTTDWYFPRIDISIPYCTYDNTELVPTPKFRAYNGGAEEWEVAGTFELIVTAEDPAGVVSFELYSHAKRIGSLENHILLARSDGDPISLSFDSADVSFGNGLRVFAEDGLGNRDSVYFLVDFHNESFIYARFYDGNSQYLPGVDFYAMPQDWDDSQAFDPELALVHKVSRDIYGDADIYDAPVGRVRLVARYGEYSKYYEFTTTPEDYRIELTEEETTFWEVTAP